MCALGVKTGFAGNEVTIENAYIKITVNGGPQEAGRFSVDTTGGDPARADDDQQNLIYGGANPWTSYTTLLINGRPYVFGGPTKRRSGFGQPIGDWVEGPVKKEEGITTTYRFGSVEASQILSIAYSTTSGLPDTARIQYRLKNLDSIPQEVGLRVVMDTMLGSNDGAPFRVGERAIETATILTGQEIPEFWQAFDSLSSPRVIAQGTLRGGELTPPDKVCFADWGTMADAPWEIPVKLGQDFTRKDEDELDSAIALFWGPVTLAPGETRTYTTYYGLGGMNLAKGTLTLGLTAPAIVVKASGKETVFKAVGYVENTGKVIARHVQLRLDLPSGLSAGEAGERALLRQLGDLEPGVSRQIVWQIKVEPRTEGVRQFSLVATAENCDRNLVSRKVNIVTPPNLEVVLGGPSTIPIKGSWWDREQAFVTATIINRTRTIAAGVARAEGVYAEFRPEEGLALAPGESAIKYIGSLAEGESFTCKWFVVPLSPGGGNANFTVRLESGNAGSQAKTKTLYINSLPAQIKMVLMNKASGTLKTGEVGLVEIQAINLLQLGKVKLTVVYDPQKVKVVSVSRGTLFVTGGENATGTEVWREPVIDAERGRIEIGGEYRGEGLANGTIARLNLIAQTSGEALFALEDVTCLDKKGQPLFIPKENLKIRVEAR